jgi:hypothetical protein
MGPGYPVTSGGSGQVDSRVAKVSVLARQRERRRGAPPKGSPRRRRCGRRGRWSALDPVHQLDQALHYHHPGRGHTRWFARGSMSGCYACRRREAGSGGIVGNRGEMSNGYLDTQVVVSNPIHAFGSYANRYPHPNNIHPNKFTMG